jgi:integrase
MRLVKRGETWFAWFYQDGKRVRRSTHCRDRRAAEGVAREFERAAADPLHPSRQTATVGDAVTMLLTHRAEEVAAGRRSAATVRFYREKAGHWTRVLGADFRLTGLTAAEVDRYVSARRAEGFAENTISKELVAMRAALKLAKRAGKWAGDVAAIFPVGFAPEYEPRRRVLAVPEVYRLLEQLEPDRAARVAFLVATGARLGESDRAERADVDRREGEGCDFVRLRGTKTAAARRTVPIVSPLARQLLQYALDHAGGEGGLLFRPWPMLHRALLRACRRAGCKATGCTIKPSRKGGCRTPECVAASLAPVTPNDLRRTCATWLREAGTPVELVAPMLGHVDIRMAVRVYARLDPAALGQRIAEAAGWTAGGPHSASPGRRMRQGRRADRMNPAGTSGLSEARTRDRRIKSPTYLLPTPAKPHHKSRAAKVGGPRVDRAVASQGVSAKGVDGRAGSVVATLPSPAPPKGGRL